MDGVAKLLNDTLGEKLSAQLATLSLEVSFLEGKYGELSSSMGTEVGEVDKRFNYMRHNFENHITSIKQDIASLRGSL
eukprot:2226793-Pyramimonas_sp.AAC.1